MEQFLLTLLGGALTFAGGFAGILYVRRLSEEDAKRTFQAAVLVVLDELGANEVNIEGLLDGKAANLELYEGTYRSQELVLAQRLSAGDRQLLTQAYAPLRSRWAGEVHSGSMDWNAMQWQEWVKPNKEALSAALEKIRAARAALAAYPPSGRS